MNRDYKSVTSQAYDLVIVGGGIYGACLAWEAALRGFSVVLVERNDFGSANSGNSLKIIHGGLRYLQQLDVKRMRESIRERRIFLAIAPHLVHPLPCLMPTYGFKMKSKPVLAMGLLLNDIISADRNRGADQQKIIPRGRILSREESKKILPTLAQNGFSGAAMWTDAQAYNSERMVLAFVLSAERAGARVFNYVRVTGYLRDKERIRGVKVVDTLSGYAFDIRAKMVINTVGPWTNAVLSTLSDIDPEKIILSKAINLIVKRPLVSDYAFALNSSVEFKNGHMKNRQSSRQLFFTPWRGRTIIGTTHLPYDGGADSYKVSERDILDFIAEINTLMPEVRLTRNDVSYFLGGILPLEKRPAGDEDVALLRHYKIFDHAQSDDLHGLISVVGVKYTTARDVAEKVIDLVSKKWQKETVDSPSRSKPLVGGEIKDFREFAAMAKISDTYRLPEDVIDQFIKNYGSEYKTVLSVIERDVVWAEPVEKGSAVIKAEVLHAVRSEHAQKLADVILRRTELGSANKPGEAALITCARIMANELQWSRKRTADEIDEVVEIYNPL